MFNQHSITFIYSEGVKPQKNSLKKGCFSMNEQQKLIKESGLPVTKVAELTGINYKKLYRVVQEDAQLKFNEIKKIELLNKTIRELIANCAEIS